MQVSQIISLGKALLKSAISFGLTFLFLRWVDFSVSQSITLAVLVRIGYEAYQTVNGRVAKNESFTPYRVVVWPKFGELLLDYKLLKDVEEATALYALWEKKDQRLISFTVLQLRPSGDWLIYSNTDKCFQTDMDFEEPIEAIAFRNVWNPEDGNAVYLKDPAIPPDTGMQRHDLSPSFYFKQAIGGYELGLTVRENWWKKMCAENSTEVFSKTKVDANYVTGEARLTIATIPYAAFALFGSTPGDYKQIKKVWNSMDSQLPLHG
jgi:hypothetical protein